MPVPRVHLDAIIERVRRPDRLKMGNYYAVAV